MAWIELGDKDIKGIFIDGYAPDFEEFRGLRKDLTDKGHLPRYWYLYYLYPRLRADKPHSEKQLINAFGATAQAIRHRSCPYYPEKDKTWGRRWYVTRCLYCTISNPHKYKTEYNSKPLKNLPAILEESKRDEEEGRKHYIHNIILFNDDPEFPCGRKRECCENWVDILHFDVKRKEDYKNYAEFENDAKEALKYYFNRLKPFWEDIKEDF